MASRGGVLSSVGLKYGAYTALGFILYFLLMKVLGLIYVLELRFLNFFILATGITLAMRHYRDISNGPIDYLKGFGIGAFTTFISTGIFSAFMFLYLRFFDVSFMHYLQETAPMGHYLTPIAASFGLMIEGDASGAVLTLLTLQYYRKGKLSVRNDKKHYILKH